MSSDISLTGVDSALRFALDGLATRHRAIANNVANVDTPGFKGKEVPFERQLQLALDRRQPVTLVRTDPQHLTAFGSRGSEMAPEVVSTHNSTLRNDGNNVDIDREMVKLADTTIKYNAISHLMSTRLSLLRSIINEGRR